MPAMTRVPNSNSLRRLLGLGENEIADAVSTAPIKEQIDHLVRLERQLPYQWTTDDDEIVDDAIMVTNGGTSAEMVAAGLSYVEPRANIVWTAKVTSQGVFAAGGYTGWEVSEALDRAHELRIMMGVERVVISIEQRGLWRNEWGKLAEKEGLG